MSGASGLSEISSFVQTRLSARQCFMFVWIQYWELKNTHSLLWVYAWGALATSRQGVSSSKPMTDRNPINPGKRHSSRIHRAAVRAVLSVARKWQWETDWVSQSFTTRTERCLIWAGGGSQPLDSKTQLQTHTQQDVGRWFLHFSS